MEWIWEIHIWTTWTLIGLIWTVHGLVYPQFPNVGNCDWEKYHSFHVRRIGLIVGPLMVLEFLTGAGLMVSGWETGHRWNLLLGIGIPIPLIWGLTALWAVPRHNQLSAGYSRRAWGSLMRCNRFRTVFWTGRGAWIVWMVSFVFPDGRAGF